MSNKIIFVLGLIAAILIDVLIWHFIPRLSMLMFKLIGAPLIPAMFIVGYVSYRIYKDKKEGKL